MRILLIGDIVGKCGYRFVIETLPELRQKEQIDLVIANAENADAGSGLTPDIYDKLIECGVDGVTLGDHIYRRKEIIPVLNREGNIVKPANFPASAPGKNYALLPFGETRVAIVSLLGRVYMRPVDCPFVAADRVLESLPPDVKVIIVDFHAEATSDKQLMGRYLDGRVSAVLGTHTHVATADEQIFPGGTAFQCDVGMTGPHHSILGRKIDHVLETTISFRPTYFHVAKEDLRICGAVVDVSEETGRATAIRRIMVRKDDA